ncbi:MAG: 2-succinyl-6-hydroxy-2,4-cyclohexadiene-1-carboxylate synthase [Chloroflexota bacterium]
MSRLPVNGCAYHVEIGGTGPPLVALHGFTGSAETWAPFRAAFGRQFTLIAIDLLGHGRTECPPDPRRYRMDRTIEDLVAILDRLGLARVDLLGYSMGGRVALHVAVAAPDRIHTLALEGASPGIPLATDRAARARSDSVLADLIEGEGIEAFVERWEQVPLFASQRGLPAEVRAALRCQRLRGNPLGLANSLRGIGAGDVEPLLDRLGQVSAPTLLIVGAFDEKYRALGREMAGRLPTATLAVVPGAGHAVHLEQPDVFTKIVLEFLEQFRPAGA